jgi:glucuronosyltransferase
MDKDSCHVFKNVLFVQVATDTQYKTAITESSEMFRAEFGVPMERAAFWLEHVIKYGGSRMRSAGHKVPYDQFLGLDVLAFFLSVFVATVVASVCLNLICQCFARRWKKKCKRKNE